MPIFFNRIPVRAPFAFDSVGNHWDQERIQRPFGYPYYHYLQTEKGCGVVEIQGKEYCLKEGEGVLIAPFVSHSYHKITDRWITSFVAITGKLEGGIAGMLDNRQIILVSGEKVKKISAILEELISRYRQFPGATQEHSVDCYRLLMEFMERTNDIDAVHNPLYLKYVEPVIKEIETNYACPLSVAELSCKVYVTPQYLSRLFVRFLGCSTYEYLTNYRITKAKELLRFGKDMEIQQIAAQVGFGDTSHFIVMFKKKVGITPRQFVLRSAMM